MTKNVVFLDYDGVVNRKMWTLVDGKWVCRFGYPEDNQVNDTQAVQWVSEFCERYGYGIVVTSTWRKYPEWESCLRNAGLREGIEILGATALPAKERGDEISEYLDRHPEIENYLVLDDDDSLQKSLKSINDDDGDVEWDGGEHEEHLVLCRSDHGFGEEEYLKAVAIHLSFKYKYGNVMGNIVDAKVPRSIEEGALELLFSTGQISTPVLQRIFSIGYARAAKLIDVFLDKGIILSVISKGRIRYKPIVEYSEARERMKL